MNAITFQAYINKVDYNVTYRKPTIFSELYQQKGCQFAKKRGTVFAQIASLVIGYVAR
jgi:hypothetical protein